jgi:hypothetical protein
MIDPFRVIPDQGLLSHAGTLYYHIQSSDRSLHSQNTQFNDTRATLQALYALFDEKWGHKWSQRKNYLKVLI